MASLENSKMLADETTILYCPACEGEYPLTFQVCPAHGLPLTKRKMVVAAPASFKAITQTIELDDPATMPAPETDFAPGEAILSNSFPSPQRDSLLAYDDQSIAADSPELYTHTQPMHKRGLFGYEFDDEPWTESEAGKNGEQKSFRTAAIATGIALAVFALIALYQIFFAGPRKPPVNRADETALLQQPTPFISTPPEASEYIEEQTEADAPESSGEASGKREARPQKPSSSSAPKTSATSPQTRRQTPQAGPQPRQPAPTQRPTINVSAPVPSQATDGRVFTRLVRSRARRTPEGYRYDLTFSIQERAGRSMRWDRLTISSISANGTRRNQTVAFPHYLGAAGMMTFTVSVDMQGATENDWRGRIVCAGVGADNAGTTLRASFGANVAP